jgi:O-antigen ligase
MSRQFAVLACIGFIGWLIRHDMRVRQFMPPYVIIPAMWLAIIGSRPLAYWLMPWESQAMATDNNPWNLLVQGSLIGAGIVVLHRKGHDWIAFVRNNKWLSALYIYFACTALWSPDSFTTVKRVARDFGGVVMVLILLSSRDPYETIRTVFVRVGYILLPLSVVLIKYYPEFGRCYSKGWELMYTGVTMHKNALGAMTLVIVLMLSLDVLELLRGSAMGQKNITLVSRVSVIIIGLWLLGVSNCKTALLSGAVAVTAFLGGRYLTKCGSIHAAEVVLVGLAAGVALTEVNVHLSKPVIAALGRQENLTGRTEVWRRVREQRIDPLVGYGFMSFWDSDAAKIYGEHTDLKTAHNGYLETYIDGGVIGVILLVAFLAESFKKAVRELFVEGYYGRAKFAFFIVFLVYNYSESAFFRLGIVWFMFLSTSVQGSLAHKAVTSVTARA